MRVLIIAAGYGTRLYPLTATISKPLLSINGKPIINFLMEKVKKISHKFYVKETIIVSNDKFFPDFLEWKKKYNVKARFINDGSNNPDERKGAVKDIQLAIGRKKGDWFILGGDNLFEDTLESFLKFSSKHKPHISVGLYDVKKKSMASRFGVVCVDSRKRIFKMEEKPKRAASSLVAACIYFFPQQSLKFINVFSKNLIK